MVQSDLQDLGGLWAHRVLLVLLVREALQASGVKLVRRGHKDRKEYLDRTVSTAFKLMCIYMCCLQSSTQKTCLDSG